jgi:hypothetical protein
LFVLAIAGQQLIPGRRRNGLLQHSHNERLFLDGHQRHSMDYRNLGAKRDRIRNRNLLSSGKQQYYVSLWNHYCRRTGLHHQPGGCGLFVLYFTNQPNHTGRRG